MHNQFILTPYFLDEVLPGLDPLAKPGWQLNKPTPVGEGQQLRLATIHEQRAMAVADAVQQGKRPISIAGDCCTTIGVLAGLQRAAIVPHLIWFDAHGDFNTWETSPSGFLGGMPLAMLVGRGEQTLTSAVGLSPLPEEKVILTDARDLDPGEKISVQNSSISHVQNVADLLQMTLPDGPLYVHFDADILDPTDAPAMNYLAPGGPSLALMQQVFQRLAATKRVMAVSVSTWNPAMDVDGRSQKTVLPLLAVLLGL